MKKWSHYQEAIFKNAKESSKHTIVEALAGSGKTTTLLEALNYVDKSLSWLLVAFNKKIAEELKQRAPKSMNGEIQTFHALGLKAISRTFKNVKVDLDKNEMILDRLIDDKDLFKDREYRYLVTKAISLAKATLSSTKEEIDALLDQYEIDPVGYDRDDFISKVMEAMDISKSFTNIIDYDDMIWFPNVLPIKVPTFDRVFVDEVQDLNRAQIEFALKACKKKGKITVLGDKFQQIYQFRGADANSMNYLKEVLKADTLGLSITYRCPVSVVKEAQKYVPQLEAAPNAIEGKVESINYETMKKNAKAGCFIISRTNAPLIGLALGFLKEGRPANIQGRDIGANLMAIIKSSKAKTIEKFRDYIDKWETREKGRLIAKHKDFGHITDKADCLRALAEHHNNLSDLKASVEKLFVDVQDQEKIILTTCHRIKGAESDVVYMLMGTFFEQNEIGNNLRYVAISRSRKELYYVVKKNKDKSSDSTKNSSESKEVKPNLRGRIIDID